MTIVGCTGHRVLPPRHVPYIRDRLMSVLGALEGDFVGVSSLAAGTDQLFASVVLDCGGRLRVVVPCRGYATSLATDELSGYRQLLARAVQVDTLAFEQPSGEVYLAAGRHVVNLADLMIAVWNGRPARGVGGTGDVVSYAEAVGKPLIVIWPPGDPPPTSDGERSPRLEA